MMFGVLNTSTSGMIAHRQWAETIASNIANQNAVFDGDGNYNPYKPKRIHFAVGDPAMGNPGGVHVRDIVDDENPYRFIYDPNSPYADERGYRPVPDVSPEIEQADMLIATRAYEANVMAAEATKSMMQATLSMLG